MPAMSTITPIPITSCAGCAITPKVATRLPSGWHRRGGEAFCRDCWRARYLLRASASRQMARAVRTLTALPIWRTASPLLPAKR